MTLKVHVVFVLFQRKYKEAGKKGVASSLYCTLPETLETRHAKEASQLHSEVNTTATKTGPLWKVDGLDRQEA